MKKIFRVAFDGSWAYRNDFGADLYAPSWDELRRLLRDYIEALAPGEDAAKSHALAALGELHWMI